MNPLTVRGLRQVTTHQTSDSAEVRRMNDLYIEAASKNDRTIFEQILADDFLCTLPDGTLLNREAFLARLASPVTITNLVAHDVTVRLMGNAAIVHAATSFSLMDGRAGKGRYTDVWERQEGKWRAVAAQFTRN